MSGTRLAGVGPNSRRLLVIAGFCLGMGLGPFVLTVLTTPVGFFLGETVASLFWPTVQFLGVVFAAIALSTIDLDATSETH
ncbi:hypothetical protein [Halomicrobium katesii]|uniref:hypothetical protein n=1 Tax=Halomicrobium katesii TaxID=437163 RepID=UPI000360D6A0|nr:hypothetical protein [Halomicrobium katesii]